MNIIHRIGRHQYSVLEAILIGAAAFLLFGVIGIVLFGLAYWWYGKYQEAMSAGDNAACGKLANAFLAVTAVVIVLRLFGYVLASFALRIVML